MKLKIIKRLEKIKLKGTRLFINKKKLTRSTIKELDFRYFNLDLLPYKRCFVFRYVDGKFPVMLRNEDVYFRFGTRIKLYFIWFIYQVVFVKPSTLKIIIINKLNRKKPF